MVAFSWFATKTSAPGYSSVNVANAGVSTAELRSGRLPRARLNWASCSFWVSHEISSYDQYARLASWWS